MKPPTLDQLRAGMAPIQPTDTDRELYRQHGYEGLKARGMFAVLDRMQGQPPSLAEENAKLRAALQSVADHCDKPSFVYDLAMEGLR